MPTLSEDGDMIGDGSIEDNNFEQLMVNMLDERDKLMETLRDTQDNLMTTKTTLKETELERDTLLHQFDLVLSKVTFLNIYHIGFIPHHNINIPMLFQECVSMVFCNTQVSSIGNIIEYCRFSLLISVHIYMHFSRLRNYAKSLSMRKINVL